MHGSIEAQKSAGSAHVHAHLFVQCLHQHTPLHEILRLPSERLEELLDGYAAYKRHVSRQVYEDSDAWGEQKERVEGAWPAYKETADLLGGEEYLAQSDSELQRALGRMEDANE
eukprot:8917829-Pyramimonas_sp.AAC.1